MSTAGDALDQGDWEDYARLRASTRHRILSASHVEAIDDFLRFASDIPANSRALDIGAGKGLFLTLLRELGFTNLTGLDTARLHAQIMADKGFEAVTGNLETGENLETLRPPYDLVLLMEVMEHTRNPVVAIEHLRSLLHSASLVYFTVPICDCIFNRVRRWRMSVTRENQVLDGDPTHIHAFSAETFNALLKKNGFQVILQRRSGFEWPGRCFYLPGRRLHLLLRSLLPERWKGNHLITVARLA